MTNLGRTSEADNAEAETELCIILTFFLSKS